MPRPLSRFLTAGLLIGCSIVLASCGESGERLEETGASLEGTITYDKQPVPYALVIVISDKGSATGKVNEDGRYHVVNCPLGEVKVAVNTDAGKGDYMSAMMSQSYKGPESKGAGKALAKFVEVPKKFHDPETSELKTTINKGANTYNIVVPK